MIIIKHLYNYGNVLNEDRVSDMVKKAIKNNCADIYKEYLQLLVAELPEYLQEHLKEYNAAIYKSCINTDQNLLSFLRQDFLTRFDIIRGKGPIEFIDGIVRIAIVELGMYKDVSSDTDISTFKIDVLFVHNSSEESKKFNPNLNGLSFSAFHKEIYAARKKFNDANRGKLINVIGSDDYDIIPIKSYNQASEYGKYTSWCVTHGKNMYSSYTKGGRRFYFCLRKGFESVKEEVGTMAPLDNYGLSMISVLVDVDGEPNYITTRWNHKHDGENNVNLRTAEQFQQVTGINFYKSFPPYTREELHKMGIVSFDEARERLEAGENPKNIFKSVKPMPDDGFMIVRLNDKVNIINPDGKLISDRWLEGCTNKFDNGFIVVSLNGACNYMDTDGKFLLETWAESCYDFVDGVAKVKLNDKYNFINTDGKFMLNKWVDYVERTSYDGFQKVYLDDQENHINADYNFISDTWFDDVTYFHGGIAEVQLNDKYNFINTEGKLIFDKWFDYAHMHILGPDDRRYTIGLNDKFNIVDNDGRLVSDKWFDKIDNSFQEGYICVTLNDKKNFLSTEGEFISDKWFDDVRDFSGGLAMVIRNGHTYGTEINLMNADGELVFDKWLKDVTNIFWADNHIYVGGKIFTRDGKEVTM